MGKKKLARFEEMKHFPNVLQPTFEELRKETFEFKGKWSADFFRNEAPLILELGCGKGEYTVQMAEKFPGKNFIGVDIKGARIYTGARIAGEKQLGNAAFVRTRIENIPFLFGQDEVREIWLTFPDPQMKNVKKRLTSSWFLKRYLLFLAEEGIIHLKTDSMFQYSYTLSLVKKNNYTIVANTENLYASGILDDILGIRTAYENQWISRGIPIRYLAYKPRKGQNPEEPEGEFEKDSYRSFGRSARSLLSV